MNYGRIIDMKNGKNIENKKKKNLFSKEKNYFFYEKLRLITAPPNTVIIRLV